jgi:hypothetical protein
MKANLLTSMVGIVLLGAAAATNAAVVTLTTTSPGNTLNINDTGVIPLTFVPSSSTFSTDWFFTLSASSGLGGAVASFNFDDPSKYGINSLTGTLYSDSAPSTPIATGANFEVSSLANGGYFVDVMGNTTGEPSGGYYSGTIGVVAPVPLPAAAWLLLSGLAGVGAMARRRKSEKLA